MNAKIAKIIRRYAKLRQLDYTRCKNYFQSIDAKQQKEDIKNMKIVIFSKGGDNMANQKLCDRPDKTIIGPEADYLPLKVKQPDGSWKDVDLCAACGMDFGVFLSSSPSRAATQQVTQATAPVDAVQQPAAPAAVTGTEQPTQ